MSTPRHRMSLDIHTWHDFSSPFVDKWCASIGEYDLGTKVFTGPTQREAINELLDYYEQDNGELRV